MAADYCVAAACLAVGRVQLCQLLGVHQFDLLQLSVSVLVDEFVNRGEAAAHAHNQLVIRNLSENPPSSEHVEASAQPRDGQLHSALVHISSEHLVNQITLDRLVSVMHWVLANFTVNFATERKFLFVLLLAHHRKVSQVKFALLNHLQELVLLRSVLVQLRHFLARFRLELHDGPPLRAQLLDELT